MPGPANSFRSQKSPSARRQFRLAFSRPAAFSVQNGKVTRVSPAAATVRSAPISSRGFTARKQRTIPTSGLRARIAAINPAGLSPAGRAALASMKARPTVKAMAVPKLGDVVSTVRRIAAGGRPGVPRHVSPVSPVALQSITPNMVNQSDVAQTLRGALRRRSRPRTLVRNALARR